MDIAKIVESSPHPAFLADEADRLLAMNPAAEELLGVPVGEALGRAFHEIIEPRDVFGNPLCADGRPLHEMVRRGEPIHAFDLDVRQTSGRHLRARLCWALRTAAADGRVPDPDAGLLGHSPAHHRPLPPGHRLRRGARVDRRR